MQSYLQQLHVLEGAAVLGRYHFLGPARKYHLIYSLLYVNDFHRGYKCLKVLKKVNQAVPKRKMFPATSTSLTLPYFLVILIFCLTSRNNSKLFFFINAWNVISAEINRFCLKSSILLFSYIDYIKYTFCNMNIHSYARTNMY